MADIKINGVTPTAFYVGDTAASAVYYGSTKLWEDAPVDPYNPLGLPSYTMRVKLTDGATLNTTYCTQVSVSPNIWDIHKESTSWENILAPGRAGSVHSGNNYYVLLEILGANTSGVTDFTCAFLGNYSLTKVNLFDTRDATTCNSMFYGDTALTDVATFNTSSVTDVSSMFNQCSALVNAPLIDTSSASNFSGMFANCRALTSVPLYNTSSATNVTAMFANTNNVQTGALALYTQMSTQASVPSSHTNAFYNCGADTVTGAAELAQIPTGWGGTMSSGFTATSVGSNLYEAWMDNFCYKSQRITVPAGVSLSSTASFVWDNTDHENTHGSTDADGGKAFLVLANPSDSTKYVVGTGLQGTWWLNSEYDSGINLPLTWSGTLSSMFTWGNLTMDNLRDTNGNVDIYVCCTYSGGTPISGDAPGGYFNTIYNYDGDSISDEGSVITVTVS